MDNAERQTQPMEEQIQPGLDVSSDKDFPQLESAKSIEKTKNAKNKKQSVKSVTQQFSNAHHLVVLPTE